MSELSNAELADWLEYCGTMEEFDGRPSNGERFREAARRLREGEEDKSYLDEPPGEWTSYMHG